MMVLTSPGELRHHYGIPSPLGSKKDMDRLDHHARAFIARSPLAIVSTCSPSGWPEASPRGDAPGFVVVENDRRLLLPDRPGNNRLHSLSNILEDNRIGLLFLVPAVSHTLRVYGRARIATEAASCERFAIKGRPARSVIDVNVELVYFHCGKAMIRSNLWAPAQWPSSSGLASLGTILSDQIAGVTAADAEARIEESIRERLY